MGIQESADIFGTDAVQRKGISPVIAYTDKTAVFLCSYKLKNNHPL